MFGIGGIFTELYKDVTFRIVPIEKNDAKQMVEEIEGKKLLEGFRNIPANKQLVIDLIMKVSKIGKELMDHIDQMDLNPVFVYGDDLSVVDAKLILK
jgi:acyl-CoA synthetase (NDP forming)